MIVDVVHNSFINHTHVKSNKNKKHYLYLYHTLVHVCSQNHSNKPNFTSQQEYGRCHFVDNQKLHQLGDLH